MTGPDRGPRLVTPRIALMVASLAIFAAIAVLYVGGFRSAYDALFWTLGIDVKFDHYVPFADFDETLAAWQCHRLGVDVYLADPCDILARPHAYSPAWFFGSYTGLGPADIGWIGPLLVAAFLVTVALVSDPRTYGEAAVYMAALLSQASMFAMERANIDLIMFLLVVGACVLYVRGPPGRIAAYVVIYAAAILKFYPIVAFALALNERKGRFLAIAAAAAVAVAVFVFASWHDLVELWPNIPRPWLFGNSFSGLNALEVVQALVLSNEPRVLGSYRVISPLLYVGVIGLLAARSLLLSPRLAGAMAGLDAAKLPSALFLTGAMIVVCSFFVAKNVAYRGIWLLTILPAILQLRRETARRGIWNAATAVILLLLWCECFHYHLWESAGNGWDAVFLMTVREPVWWVFIFGLMTMLWAQMSRSPAAGGLVDYARRHLARRNEPL
jgi:hypothetical protein